MISHSGPPLSTGFSPCEFSQNLHDGKIWKIHVKTTCFDSGFQEQNQRNSISIWFSSPSTRETNWMTIHIYMKCSSTRKIWEKCSGSKIFPCEWQVPRRFPALPRCPRRFEVRPRQQRHAPGLDGADGGRTERHDLRCQYGSGALDGTESSRHCLHVIFICIWCVSIYIYICSLIFGLVWLG